MGDVRAAAAIVQRDSTMPAVSAMVHAIRCCSWSVLAALALMFGAPAFALKPPNVTDGEMALAPPYCPDTMGFKYGDAYFNTSPRAAGWVAQMGKGFWAVHHYCWALINFRRTMTTLGPPEQRRGNLLGVMGDYQYVLDNVPPNFILLPEIYTKIGDLQVLLSNISAAFDAYRTARTLKADYWPAYTQWADVLIKSGQKEEAKGLLRLGLQYAPGTPALLDRYRALGANPSEIESTLPVMPATENKDAATAVVSPAKAASAAAPLQ